MVIDWLLNYGVEKGERGLMFCFWFSWGQGYNVGYCNVSLRLIFGGFRGPFEKSWDHRWLYGTVLKRVLDIIRIKIRHSKGENKSESSR